MKPILFNTAMVRAILDGRKTVTRRAVKFKGGGNPNWTGYVPDGGVLYGSNNIPAAKAQFKPGDILYVRETWVKNVYGTGSPYFYKASPETHEYDPDMERLAVFADKGKKKQPEAKEEICETKKQMTKPKYVPAEETYAVGSVQVAVSNIVRYLTIKKDGDSVTLSYEQAAELLEFLAWLGRERCQAEVDDAADDND